MLSKMYKIPLLNEETVLSETLESLKESDLILQSSDNEEEIQQVQTITVYINILLKWYFQLF